jgi:hypothetical protein
VVGALALYWLAQDDAGYVVDRATAMVGAAAAVSHRNVADVALGALSTALIYLGRDAEAMDVAVRRQTTQRQTGFDRQLMFRVDCSFRLAMAALALAARKGAGQRGGLLAIARSAMHDLDGDGRFEWVSGLVDTVGAGLALLSGDRDEARLHHAAAARRFGAAQMHAHAAVATLRAGQLGAGVLAEAEAQRATTALRELGVANVDAFSAVLACPIVAR